MRLTKDKKTGVYIVHFKDQDNVDHQKSTGCTALAEANEVVKQAGIREMELAGKVKALRADTFSVMRFGEKITVGSALNDHIAAMKTRRLSPNSIDTFTNLIKAWARRSRCMDMPVQAFTSESINAFINADDGTSIATREARLFALRGFCAYLVQAGLRADNPAGSKRVSVDRRALEFSQLERKARQPFTEAEYDAIIHDLQGFWKAATVFSYWLGLRLIDIATMQWESFDRDHIIVWTRKSGRRIGLPLADPLLGSGELSRVLTEIPVQSPTWLFPRERKVVTNPKARHTLSHEFRAILNKAHITKEKSFHCLRHSFAHRLKDSGRTLEEIGVLLGHSDKETTRIYIGGIGTGPGSAYYASL